MVSVAFASSEAGVTFTCSLDGDDLGPCASPMVLQDLPHGPHEFAVEARDSAGSASVARRTFEVDAQGPVVTIVAPTPESEEPSNVPYSFVSDEDATQLGCTLDDIVFSCQPSGTLPSVTAGEHTLAVYGYDQFDNVGPTTTVTFTVAG